jgi:hypothetical protein
MANRKTYPEGNIPTSGDSDQILLSKAVNLLGGIASADVLGGNATASKQDEQTALLGNIDDHLTVVPTRAAVVTPSNSVDLPNAAVKGVYVGVTGDVKVDLVTAGTGIVFKSAPVGILAVQAKRVYATGTTATNLVALY